MFKFYKIFIQNFSTNILKFNLIILLLSILFKLTVFTKIKNEEIMFSLYILISLFIFLSNIVLIIYTNHNLYHRNLNWIRNLPLSRMKLMKSHALHVIFQLFESILFTSISLIALYFIMRYNNDSFEILLIEGYNFFISFLKSTTYATLIPSGEFFALFILYISSSLMLLFSLCLKRYNSSSNINTTGYIISAFIMIYLLLLDIKIIIFGFLTAAAIYTAIYIYRENFKLRPLSIRITTITIMILGIIFSSILYSYSYIKISSNNTSAQNVINELSFQSTFAHPLTIDNYLKIISNPKIEEYHIKEITKLYKKKTELIPLNHTDFDYLAVIKNGTLSSAKGIIKLLDIDKLSAHDILNITDTMARQYGYSSCDLRVLFKRKFSDKDLITIISETNHDSVTAAALKRSIFSTHPMKMLSYIKSNVQIYQRDPLLVAIDAIEMLSWKKVTLKELFHNSKGVRAPSSLLSLEKCNNLSINKTSEISESNLRDTVFCSNMAYIKNIHNSKYHPITGLIKLPLSKETEDILAINLKIITK